MTALFILHLAATSFMMGLIWFVQIVHYPLFQKIGDSEYHDYERRHIQRTTYVVAPVMAIELLTIPAALLAADQGVWGPIMWANALLLGMIWLLTMTVLAPTHQKLAKQRDAVLLKRLVVWNWPRTVLWTMRTAILFTYVAMNWAQTEALA